MHLLVDKRAAFPALAGHLWIHVKYQPSCNVMCCGTIHCQTCALSQGLPQNPVGVLFCGMNSCTGTLAWLDNQSDHILFFLLQVGPDQMIIINYFTMFNMMPGLSQLLSVHSPRQHTPSASSTAATQERRQQA